MFNKERGIMDIGGDFASSDQCVGVSITRNDNRLYCKPATESKHERLKINVHCESISPEICKITITPSKQMDLEEPHDIVIDQELLNAMAPGHGGGFLIDVVFGAEDTGRIAIVTDPAYKFFAMSSSIVGIENMVAIRVFTYDYQ